MLRTHTPESVMGVLRRARRLARRQKFYSRRYLHLGHVVRHEELVDDLRELGMQTGDVVLVHSSLSGLGFVDGGADTVIDALRDVLGSEGTLAMPAFSIRGDHQEALRAGVTFHVLRTPSHAGKLTEVFRQRTGVRRSLHPSHSVSALGPLAERLTCDHHRDMTPFGPNSPFARLIEARGKIVCLAVEIAYMTSVHAFEDLTVDYPEPVYASDVFQARVIDADGRDHLVTTRAHNRAVSNRRLEKRPEVLRTIRNAFRRSGILREATVGLGRASLVGAREMHEQLGKLLKQGITIYAPSEA